MEIKAILPVPPPTGVKVGMGVKVSPTVGVRRAGVDVAIDVFVGTKLGVAIRLEGGFAAHAEETIISIARVKAITSFDCSFIWISLRHVALISVREILYSIN